MSEFELDGEYVPLNEHNLTTVKNKLNNVGQGFCLAKWTQITLHLGTGMIHSCHHPTPHKIPLESLKEDPLNILNTPVMKAARTDMLNDVKTKECDYCWRIESGNGNSDRYLKSLEPWALNDFDRISNLNGDENVYPNYLEVSFSNVCNMKCAYCGPEFSSKWVEDLKKNGPVIINKEIGEEQWTNGWQDLDTLNYKNKDVNPYVDAFWEIFPEVYKHLKVYRITGGEPLMSKDLFKTLDWIIANPNPELDFAINTNLAVPEKLWNLFIEKITIIKSGGYVKKITVFSSIEGWGERAEYTRNGMDFKLLQVRYEQLCAIGNIRAVIMAAFNLLSITSFGKMLEWHLGLKKKYNSNNGILTAEIESGFALMTGSCAEERYNNSKDHFASAGIDIPYLRHPTVLDAQICSDEMVDDHLIPLMNYMAENTIDNSWSRHQGFEIYEMEKLRRIVVHRLYYKKKSDPSRLDIDIQRSGFYDFVNDLDKRNGTNFVEVFPEMTKFYELCKDTKKTLEQKHKEETNG
tara:strand:- start:1069 stop:2628 length:1560 start_codon:yes stop_codon:yes gene_type:complete